MSPLAAIEVRDLNKRYGRIQALIDVSIDVQRQELFALLGPNGAGKTTLLHILCGLLEPDSGTVRIGGLDVFVQPARSRRTMGVVFQEPSLDDRLTVYENLNFHGLVYGIPRKLRQQRIDEMLELVELADWREKLVRTLSSGMKRRVELARALTHDANILFLDEPTVGLDAQSRERIWEYIGRLRSLRELTVVVTTHYIEEVEACDRVCVIDRGIILALNTPAALKVAHGQQLLRVVPREEATASEVMAAYPDTTLQRNAEIIIKSSGDAFAEAFLSRYGSRIRRLSVEEPSLESVFLSLTGREIREQAANPRERTLAFGRRGGEHTR
jgi:ABC-2 type transport system ATP-binding protein